ncbi:6-carboxytetrahydropterin synthase (plasmid) [Rhizobium leguminosarum]|uniref:6-carboxytetrahydropterin synthase n=1 Tax=Rhizobium leguminosarum TaxID=384 RepID=UPI0007C80F1A|nr:6-carboxytetrahydropterin synthase [Rhizobium leguminosarum]UIK01378.1 6-carboxytetrahydropterin synthase [Rhizobium leguminosarum]UIK14283.1 6-carboxytetrahydropterin synthase [Rhizobium leguminosarum]WFT90714.1 6-carboxytetrahydropterin synthase [Rhizobium leguminosarum]
MQEYHLITREIGIDAAHRIPHHESKCHNLHGHRYKIAATCVGPLCGDGEQTGMVLDFGFLKDEMMAEIDACCDHGMMIWVDDPWIGSFLPKNASEANAAAVLRKYRDEVTHAGQKLIEGPFGKTLLLASVPTAENLAKHWFDRLAPRVRFRSHNRAHLLRVEVWETPNCMATYNTQDPDWFAFDAVPKLPSGRLSHLAGYDSGLS